MERLPFTQWADVNRNERFVSIEPLSGYRMVQREDEGYVIYLGAEIGSRQVRVVCRVPRFEASTNAD